MTNRESAHAWGKERDGLGVSMQLWAIMCKVREVDAWITCEQNRTLREGHPELSFYAAAGRPLEHNKRKPAGREERLDVSASFVDRAMIVEWLHPAHRSGAAKDDILDALALCWSATRLALGDHCTLPTDPPRDSRDLPMEMVF
jgi:predicted RNase H-like nuclease